MAQFREVTIVVEGYTYDRYLGYTYRVVKGRRRRAHHWQTITVPGYSYTRRYALGPAKPKATPAAPKPKAKRKTPPPAAKPKAKRKRKPKPKAPPKSKPPEPPKPKPLATPKGWMSAAEWQDFLDQQAESEKKSIEWDGDIFKKNPASDVIARDLFVWPSPKYPRGMTLKSYPQVGEKVFYMARLWVLIEHTEDAELFVWVRTARLRHVMDFDAAKVAVEEIAKSIERDLETWAYLAFRGLVGWTLYTVGQTSRRRRKKEGTD